MNLQKVVLFLGALFSSAAFACPNLTGNYACTYENGQAEAISLTQEIRDGVTYFKMGNAELAADNQARAIPEDDSMKEGSLRGWCEPYALKVEVLGKVYDSGEFFGDLAAQISFSLNAENNLDRVTSGTLKAVKETYPLDNTMTCIRNP